MTDIPAYRRTPNEMKRAAAVLNCALAVPHTSRTFRWRPRPDVILVTNNSTETEWAQALFEQASAVCFIRGRLQWVSTIQGQIASYFGRHVSLFRALFDDYGVTAAIWENVTLCATCGGRFTPPRSDARYCSSRCRQKAYRARQIGAAS